MTDEIRNGNKTKRFISIPTVPAWIGVLIILVSFLYNVLGASWSMERDIEDVNKLLVIQQAQMESMERKLVIAEGNANVIERNLRGDLDEIKFNMKRLFDHMGITYIER
jgi:hypothetical protein